MNCALCSDVKGGALPCGKSKIGKGKGSHPGKSSDCPDDKIMVNRKFFYQRGRQGHGVCEYLTHDHAIPGTAMTTWKFPTLGKESLVLTKVWVTHPTKASKPVGLVLFKRLVTHTCTGENPAFCTKGATVADVHKVGYCVKCHYDVFPSVFANRAKNKHRRSFVRNCLPKAIDENGNIKPAFQCTGKDKKKAMASISGF